MDSGKTYYNVHCHIFNLQTVYSEETREIFKRRLKGAGLSDGGVELVILLLRGALDQQGLLTALFKVFDPRRDKDILEFLRVGTMPSMDDVTDWLMQQLPPNMVITPLMMDITSDGNDTDLFEAHYKATMDQMSRYPGRIRPFVAVSPKRKRYADRIQQAFADGFVGLKLYPSLGYGIESIEDAVAACVEANKPIMQHCSRGGFYAEEEFIGNSSPTLWEPYLKKYDTIRICFGHFGGENDFIYQTPVGESNWTADILYLMERYPGKVYADISYHSVLMSDKETYNETYLARIFRILEDKRHLPYVLWGSDSFLVRQKMSEDTYLDRFQILRNSYFDRIASENPVKYLNG